MLTNIELEDICHSLHIPLVGVFSKDKLPRRAQPGGYIINLQDSGEGTGTHWVSLSIDRKGHASYFDSYGQPPPRDVMTLVNRKVECNTTQLQGLNQGVCGWYCIAFLWYMLCRRGTLQGFVRLFSHEDHVDNLKILKAMLLPL